MNLAQLKEKQSNQILSIEFEFIHEEFNQLLGMELPELIPIAKEANGSFIAWWHHNSKKYLMYLSSEWMPFQLICESEESFLQLLHYGMGPAYRFLSYIHFDIGNKTKQEEVIKQMDDTFFSKELVLTEELFSGQSDLITSIGIAKPDSNSILENLTKLTDIRVEFEQWKVKVGLA